MRYKFLSFAFAASTLLATAAFAQHRLYLPQVADGRFAAGSFRTTLVLTNNTSQTAATVLRLTDDAGRPLQITLAGLGTNSTFNLSPGASRFLQTEGAGALTSGAAEITSDASISAVAIVSVLDSDGQFQSEVGIAAAPALAEFTFPAELSIFFDTGFAIFNPADSSVVLAVELLDEEGRGVMSTQVALPPKGHIARFVSELFPFASRPNIRGSVSVAASGNVAAVALRQNRRRLSYTALPVAAGIARRPATDAAPLLSTTRTGINATSDIVVNETLPEGLRLSGAIRGPGVPRFISARTADRTFGGTADPVTGTYSIALPPGTYFLTVGFEPFHAPYWPAFNRVRVSADAGTVQVSADTIRDITLPETPVFPISGRILGLEGLPGARSTIVSFASEDGRIQASFELDAEGAYHGLLPSGRYRAGLERVNAAPPQESLGFLNLGSLNVNEAPATGDYSIPLLAQLSGTLRIGGSSAPEGAVISAVAGAQFADLTSYAFTSTDSAGAYHMLLANNRSYAVHVGVPLGVGRFLSYDSVPVVLAGPIVLDVDVPPLPGTVTVSGRVTGFHGEPAANAIVSASSRSISGAGGVTFSASARTDAAGNYTLTLLSGATYTFTFTPASP